MKKITKKITLILSFSILLTGNTWATGQLPDHLYYKGKTEILFNNPLESYFNKQRPKPKKLFTKRTCSAVWRGYVATWEIKKKTLYLVKLVEGSCAKKPAVIPLSTLFAGKKTLVKADWFSGELRLQQGKQLKYANYGYETLYEKEVVLTIEKGLLIKEESIINPPQQAKKPILLNQKKIEQQSPATESDEYFKNHLNTTKIVIVDKVIHNSIYQISQKTGFSVEAILAANPAIDISNLRVGDEVVLPRIR